MSNNPFDVLEREASAALTRMATRAQQAESLNAEMLAALESVESMFGANDLGTHLRDEIVALIAKAKAA